MSQCFGRSIPFGSAFESRGQKLCVDAVKGVGFLNRSGFFSRFNELHFCITSITNHYRNRTDLNISCFSTTIFLLGLSQADREVGMEWIKRNGIEELLENNDMAQISKKFNDDSDVVNQNQLLKHLQLLVQEGALSLPESGAVPPHTETIMKKNISQHLHSAVGAITGSNDISNMIYLFFSGLWMLCIQMVRMYEQDKETLGVLTVHEPVQLCDDIFFPAVNGSEAQEGCSLIGANQLGMIWSIVTLFIMALPTLLSPLVSIVGHAMVCGSGGDTARDRANLESNYNFTSVFRELSLHAVLGWWLEVLGNKDEVDATQKLRDALPWLFDIVNNNLNAETGDSARMGFSIIEEGVQLKLVALAPVLGFAIASVLCGKCQRKSEPFDQSVLRKTINPWQRLNLLSADIKASVFYYTIVKPFSFALRSSRHTFQPDLVAGVANISKDYKKGSITFVPNFLTLMKSWQASLSCGACGACSRVADKQQAPGSGLRASSAPADNSAGLLKKASRRTRVLTALGLTRPEPLRDLLLDGTGTTPAAEGAA